MISRKIISEGRIRTAFLLLFFSLSIAFVLFVHQALPFFSMPTLAQAFWSMGFAQSFSNGPLFDFHARDFGIPGPAGIAFGLAGAWPASLFIRMGIGAADAYSLMYALWLGVAMYCAYRIARQMGAERCVSMVGAVVWMTMPVIWVHAGYSMLALGIALLSFYFRATFLLFQIGSTEPRIGLREIALYPVAAIISIFMDGYTFMMFATGASLLLVCSFLVRPEFRRVLMRVAAPVHLASFAIAYLLYALYIGKSSFETYPTEFFRGWGLDLAFLVVPTKGVLWLSDLLHISVERSDKVFFGDGSVWATTFALPVVILGLMAWWQTRRRTAISTGLLLVVGLAFYMALGPSLKINSMKPVSMQLNEPGQQSALMSPEFALMPTGNAWITDTLPGFNVMRASYRWIALSIFALWLLMMIGAAQSNGARLVAWRSLFIVLIILNIPDLRQIWQGGEDRRDMFSQIDHDLVPELSEYIGKGETVAFVPWGNDFIVNYLAPKAGFRTYNIGGDKNLSFAQKRWPSELLDFGRDIDASKAPGLEKMLVDGTANVIIIPYFDMLWSAHLWVCADQTIARLSPAAREAYREIPGFVCPEERKAELNPAVQALREQPYLDVSETAFFAAVRLHREFSSEVRRPELLRSIYAGIHYPLVFGTGFGQGAYVMSGGWHSLEEHHVWSDASATLRLPVPAMCETKNCHALLKFSVFGASTARPVSVTFSSVEGERRWSQNMVAASGDLMEAKVPLTGVHGGVSELSIEIPNATSPLALGGSSDTRVLGIALQRIELTED